MRTPVNVVKVVRVKIIMKRISDGAERTLLGMRRAFFVIFSFLNNIGDPCSLDVPVAARAILINNYDANSLFARGDDGLFSSSFV